MSANELSSDEENKKLVDDKIILSEEKTESHEELDLAATNFSFEKIEKDLANELRMLCDASGKEKEPKKSAKVLHKLGQLYLTKCTQLDNSDGLKMASLIRSACLFNAALAREPENIQAVERDLKNLCCQVLIKADARDKEADLIGQSKLVQNDINRMRNMVDQRLDEIKSFESEEISEKERESRKIYFYKSLQDEIATQYTNIMAKLLHYCQNVMGAPPCKFALIGLGSLARKEITPYSDFEHIIVLENGGLKESKNQKNCYSEQISDHKILNYFRWLSVIFQIVIINLQETILSNVYIPCLRDKSNIDWFFDENTKRGICFDSMMPHACKFPLGRTEPTEKKQFTTELIKPVDEMLDYLAVDEDVKNGYHLKDILTKVCYVGGEKAIFEEFQDKVYRNLEKENLDSKKQRIKLMLIEDLDNFATRSKFLDLSSTSFNLKKDFYRSSSIFISALGQIENVRASSCFDISEALAKKKKISRKVKHYQMYAVALACELRLRWYSKQKCQMDIVKNKIDGRDSIQLVLDTMSSSKVIKYFQITYALQCDISKQFDLKKIHFYTDSSLLNCKLYYRFKEFQKFYNFVKNFVKSEIDKTIRLHSSEEILNQIEYESKQHENFNKDSILEGPANIKELIFDQALWFKKYGSFDEAKELFEIYLDLAKKSKHQSKEKVKNKLEDQNFISEAQDLVLTRNKTNSSETNEILANEEVAKAIFQIGSCLTSMRNHEDAISYLQKFLEIKEQTSIDLNLDDEVSETLNNIGVCLINMLKPEEAIIYLQRSLNIKEKISFDLSIDLSFARLLNNIGNCLNKMNKLDEAVSYLQRSLGIYEQASLDVAVDVHVASTLSNIGNCLLDMHKPSDAIPYLKRSINICEKASVDHNFDINLAEPLNNLGLCFKEKQEHVEAIIYLKFSLGFKEQASLDLSVDVSYALTLNNIGRCLMEMEKPDESITYLQRSLKIKEKASRDTDIAETLHDIVKCLLNMQKHGEAISYLQKLLKIYDQMSLDVSVDANIASTLNDIGVCMMNDDVPWEALTYLEKSLEIKEQLSVDSSKDVDISRTLFNVGICLINIQEPSNAISYLQKSLKILENTSHDGIEDASFSQVLKNIALCLLAMDKFGDAIEYLKRLQKVQEEVSANFDTDTDLAETLNNIGLCLMNVLKPAEAITYLLRSLEMHEKVSVDLNVDFGLAATLNNIGICFNKVHKPSEAIGYLQRSLKILEKLSFDLGEDNVCKEPLKNVVSSLIDMNKPGEAIIYLQKLLDIKEQESFDLCVDVSFAETLNDIGKCLMDINEPGEALTYLLKSLKIKEQASRDPTVDVDVAATFNGIGLCLKKLHKSGGAFD